MASLCTPKWESLYVLNSNRLKQFKMGYYRITLWIWTFSSWVTVESWFGSPDRVDSNGKNRFLKYWVWSIFSRGANVRCHSTFPTKFSHFRSCDRLIFFFRWKFRPWSLPASSWIFLVICVGGDIGTRKNVTFFALKLIKLLLKHSRCMFWWLSRVNRTCWIQW